MKHIRIPVTDRSPESRDGEGAWFGYLYAWQFQSNGAVGTRLELIDDRSFPSVKIWDETKGFEAMGAGYAVPLEQDVLDILAEGYKGWGPAGSVQYKVGRHWVGLSGMKMS